MTTISERFKTGEYASKKDYMYRIYHDIYLVSTILIHFYAPGTRSYQMVDKFYKFATELLLRECYRLGLNSVNRDLSIDQVENSDFFECLSRDFIKISTNYSVPIIESYHISTKEAELFSSTISKSSLDKRPVDLPNNNFELVKLLPQTGKLLSNKLGFVAANTSNIPDPTLAPTEMMTNFLHPNWYSLPTTNWLKYGTYHSFAPTIAENGSVINSSQVGDIWLQRHGYMQLWKLNHPTLVKERSEKIPVKENNTPSETKLDKKTEQDMKTDEESSEETSIENVSISQVMTEYNPVSINLENLYNWTPGNVIDDDEMKAFEDATQDKLVSKLLVQLQLMKTERLQKGKIFKPTSKEVQLYHKVQRILKESILANYIKTIPKVCIQEFPVLQANYSGNISVVRTLPNRKKKYKK